MFYCVASLRKITGQTISEFIGYAKGKTKGGAIAEVLKTGGVILWFEEISREDYEIIEDAIDRGEFGR